MLFWINLQSETLISEFHLLSLNFLLFFDISIFNAHKTHKLRPAPITHAPTLMFFLNQLVYARVKSFVEFGDQHLNCIKKQESFLPFGVFKDY